MDLWFSLSSVTIFIRNTISLSFHILWILHVSFTSTVPRIVIEFKQKHSFALCFCQAFLVWSMLVFLNYFLFPPAAVLAKQGPYGASHQNSTTFSLGNCLTKCMRRHCCQVIKPDSPWLLNRRLSALPSIRHLRPTYFQTFLFPLLPITLKL